MILDRFWGCGAFRRYTEQQTTKLVGHTKGINSLTYNAEHRFLVSSGFDHDVFVWSPFVNTLLYKLKGHRAALVIVPSSVLDNWLREVKMWTKLNVAAIRKGSEKDETLRRARTGAADVVVASYGMCEGLDLSQGPATWEVVVIDEVHSYKNPKSNRYAQVLPIRRRCKVLFGLTGTPLQNNLDELHTLLGLCSSAKLGSSLSCSKSSSSSREAGSEPASAP